MLAVLHSHTERAVSGSSQQSSSTHEAAERPAWIAVMLLHPSHGVWVGLHPHVTTNSAPQKVCTLLMATNMVHASVHVGCVHAMQTALAQHWAGVLPCGTALPPPYLHILKLLLQCLHQLLLALARAARTLAVGQHPVPHCEWVHSTACSGRGVVSWQERVSADKCPADRGTTHARSLPRAPNHSRYQKTQ